MDNSKKTLTKNSSSQFFDRNSTRKIEKLKEPSTSRHSKLPPPDFRGQKANLGKNAAKQGELFMD